MAYESMPALGAETDYEQRLWQIRAEAEAEAARRAAAEREPETDYEQRLWQIRAEAESAARQQAAREARLAQLTIARPAPTRVPSRPPPGVPIRLIRTARTHRQRMSGLRTALRTLGTRLRTLQTVPRLARIAAEPEIASLRQQVADFTSQLATAQQEHLVSAQEAAEANRAEVAALQEQIRGLTTALQTQQTLPTPDPEVITDLNIQIQDLTGQMQTAQAAVEEADQAILATQQEMIASPNGVPEEDKLAKYLPYIIGGGVVAGGVIIWKFLVAKK